MKKMIRTLAVAACLSAGILVGINPAEAQTKPAQKTTTGTHSEHGKTASKQSSSSATNRSDMKAGMAMDVKDDAEFLRKAYEGGLAEISLARLAAEKGSSEKVKDYAQEMIEEHTMANQMIAAMISGNGGTDNMASGTTGAAGSGMGTGSGTAAGTGTGSTSDMGTAGSGVGASGTGAGTGTSGSTGATGSSSTATGSAGAAGTGSTGATGSDATGATGSAGTSGTAGSTGTSGSTGATSGSAGATGSDASGTAGSMAADAAAMVSPEVKARESYILSTDLNAEHKALEARLSKLSGATFDRQYMQAMVKDHAKMVKMVEAKANEAENADQPSAAQTWAKQHLPVMQKHLKRAEKLAQSTGSSTSKK